MRLAALVLAVVCCCVAAAQPPVSPEQFRGKVVLVTGGSSGIGFATAMAFARCGARVVICARDSNPAWFNGSFAELRINADPQVRAAGGSGRFVRTDVSNLAHVKQLMASILAREGTLDIAVNNAGITGPLGKINTIGSHIGGPHDPLYVNTYGVVNALFAEVDYWVSAKKNGVVVNVASINGLKAAASGSLYAASKHAIIGLTKSVAIEYGKGTPVIRVNALAPGLTETPLTRNQVKWMEDGRTQPWEGRNILPDDPLWEKWKQPWAALTPCEKVARPEDQANMILFLCSNEASYISGSTMSVDCGSNAK